MRPEPANPNDSRLEIDAGNEPVPVAPDVEHKALFHHIGGWEALLHVLERPPAGILDLRFPGGQPPASPGVSRLSFRENVRADDLHVVHHHLGIKLTAPI